MVGLHLKHCPATPALSQKNPGNFKKRVNPGHLVNFSADQMNRLGGGIQADAHPLCRPGFLHWRRPAAPIRKIFPAALSGAAFVAFAKRAFLLAAARAWLAGFERIRGGSWFECLGAAADTRPSRTEGKF